MKRLGWKRRIGASSLRGIQGRSVTNQNGQAAEEKKTKGRGGLDAARTFLASGSGRSVFCLTSPLIGLPGSDNPRSRDSGVVLTGSLIPRYTPTHSGQTLR